MQQIPKPNIRPPAPPLVSYVQGEMHRVAAEAAKEVAELTGANAKLRAQLQALAGKVEGEVDQAVARMEHATHVKSQLQTEHFAAQAEGMTRAFTQRVKVTSLPTRSPGGGGGGMSSRRWPGACVVVLSSNTPEAR